MFASEIREGNYRRPPGPIRRGMFRRDAITCNGHDGGGQAGGSGPVRGFPSDGG